MLASLKVIVGLFRFVRELIFGKEDQTVSKQRKMIRNIVSAIVVASLLVNAQLGVSAFKLAHTIYQNKQKIEALGDEAHKLSTENDESKKTIELLKKEVEAYRLVCMNGQSPTSAGSTQADSTAPRTKPHRQTNPPNKDPKGSVRGDTLDSISKHLSE